MVAIRASHLLTPEQFVIEDWSESLAVAPAVRQKLIETWHYNCGKLQDLDAKERQYLLALFAAQYQTPPFCALCISRHLLCHLRQPSQLSSAHNNPASHAHNSTTVSDSHQALLHQA